MRISSIVALLVTILINVSLFFQFFEIKQHVAYEAYQATIANNASSMLMHTKKLKLAMEHYGMTQGDTSLFFKSEKTDLANIYGTVTGIIKELNIIKKIPRKTDEYKMGLESVREEICNLGYFWLEYIWTKNWFYILIATFIWVWPISNLFVKEVNSS